MASFSRKASNFALIVNLLYVSSAIIQVSCFQYEVGGERAWMKPDGSEYETYNEWAQHHRFHIGDTLYFKYTNDSVLVVTSQDYGGCSLNNPVLKFEDGSTVFGFDHSGFYYFISGQPGHCQAGQKMIVWVMGVHHSNTTMISGSPASSPASESEGPAPTGSQGTNADSWGPSQSQSQSQSQSNSGHSASILLSNVFMGVVILLACEKGENQMKSQAAQSPTYGPSAPKPSLCPFSFCIFFSCRASPPIYHHLLAGSADFTTIILVGTIDFEV